MFQNILLIGHGGFYNRGCEAIIRTTVELIRSVIRDCKITLMSFDSYSDKEQIEKENFGVDEIIEARPNGAKRYSFPWVLQTINRRARYNKLNFYDYLSRSYYRNASIVISVGGDNFTEDYSGPKKFFESLKLAKYYGAKTVIWGASIGPFKTENENIWAKELNQVDLITVREGKTQEYLEQIGVSTNVFRVSDPAFILTKKKPTNFFPFTETKAQMRVGIGMSDLIRGQLTKNGADNYIKCFADFCIFLCDTYNAEILFVPHVTKRFTNLDDYAINYEVAQQVNRPGNCFVLPEILNACEMKYFISSCDYFIGARTHSTIASFSTQVPTISIGYSTKAWGINLDVLGNDNYVIDFRNLNTQTLLNKYMMLVHQSKHIKQTLQRNLPTVIRRARQSSEYLQKLINN